MNSDLIKKKELGLKMQKLPKDLSEIVTKFQNGVISGVKYPSRES